MPTYNVSTGFTGIDKVTPAFKRMGKSAFAASTKMKGAFNRVNKVGTIVGGTLIAGGITRGISAITSGIGGLAREFVSFDDAIVGAGAKFKDINLSTAQGQKQLLALKQAAKEAGATTVFSTAESAKGLEFLAMAGFTSAQAMESLNTIQNLAIATGVEFAQAADQSSDLLGAFGLAAEDATVQAKNFERLNDVLTLTANSANVSLSDMFETMKVAGPIAGVYGASLEEVAAITGVLGNAGIKGSLGATALKNVMVSLAKEGSLEEFGIQTLDAAGDMKSMTRLLSEFGNKISKFGSGKQTQAITKVFGKIPLASVAIIKDNIANIDKLKESLLNAGGTAKLTAEQMSKSLGNRLKLLSSAASAFAFKFFEAFAGEGTDGITILTNAISNFDVKPIINGLKTTFTIISALLPLIKVVVVIWLAWAAILKVQAIIMGTMAAITTIWTATQWALNAALNANPIGLVVLAVVALIAIGVLLFKNWGKIKAFFINMWIGIKNAFSASVDFMKALLFTFADEILSTYGNIFKLIVKGIASVGAFIGIDVSGLDNLVNKISKTQEEVRAKSLIGGVEAPNAAREDSKRALDGKIDLNIKTSPGLESSVEKNTAENVDISNAGLNN